MKVGDIAHEAAGPTVAGVFLLLVAWLTERLRRKPRPVVDAEALKAEAEAELTTTRGYQQLVSDLRAEIDRYEEKVAELRDDGHKLRGRIHVLERLTDAWFSYTDKLEQLVTEAGLDLPKRPAIIAQQGCGL